jgi:hypothetical protein
MMVKWHSQWLWRYEEGPSLSGEASGARDGSARTLRAPLGHPIDWVRWNVKSGESADCMLVFDGGDAAGRGRNPSVGVS